MEELGLPERLFDSGYEPTGRKRVNNYFTLRWVENIKPALDDDHLKMLAESQFQNLMKMGNHTFPVMFVHYLLSRQLVTKKKYELWWVFAGKPIRYALADFAMVTGLNCDAPGRSPTNKKKKNKKAPISLKNKKFGEKKKGKMWENLFGDLKKPTPNWILDKLLGGRKYKDSLTRFRLALVILVEGLLCPTSGTTNIRPEVVEMVADIDGFLKYPWGRDSFLLTVKSAKARSAAQFVQETVAIQGFAHAMVLVTVSCCPEIIASGGGGDPLVRPGCPIEDVIQSIIEQNLTVNIVTARTIDQKGQANVRSLISQAVSRDECNMHFKDEEDDVEVAHMLILIAEDFPWDHNSWRGGVKASEVEQKKPGDEETEASAEEDSSESMGGEGARSSKESSPQPPTPGEGGYGKDHHGSCSYTENGVGHRVDIPLLLRQAVDDIEERSIRLYAGYRDSMKQHFEIVVEKLKCDIAQMLEGNFHVAGNIPDTKQANRTYACEGFTSREKNGKGTNPGVGNGSNQHQRESLGRSCLAAAVGVGSSGDMPVTRTVAAANMSEGTPVQTRVSKRTHSGPPTYTSSLHVPKKPRIPHTGKGEGVKEPNLTSGSIVPTTIPCSSINLIAGFTAFVKPHSTSIDEFKASVNSMRKFIFRNGLELDKSDLEVIFHSTAPLPEKALEVLVMCIQERCDSDPSLRFDFFPPSFIPSLQHYFSEFSATEAKETYLFPPCCSLPYPGRHPLGSAIDLLYCPFHVDGAHWIGVAVDIRACAIYVFDCNTACITDSGLEKYLKPLSQMIPHIIREAIGFEYAQSIPIHPFPINRLDIEFLCEVPGLAAVASVILMELHATKQLLLCSRVTDVDLRFAAQHYALKALKSATQGVFQ